MDYLEAESAADGQTDLCWYFKFVHMHAQITHEAILKNSFSSFQAHAVFPCKDYERTWP